MMKTQESYQVIDVEDEGVRATVEKNEDGSRIEIKLHYYRSPTTMVFDDKLNIVEVVAGERKVAIPLSIFYDLPAMCALLHKADKRTFNKTYIANDNNILFK